MLDQRRQRIVGPVDEEAHDDRVGRGAAPRDEATAPGRGVSPVTSRRRGAKCVGEAPSDRESLALVSRERDRWQELMVDRQRRHEGRDRHPDDEQRREGHGDRAHDDPHPTPPAGASAEGIEEYRLGGCGRGGHRLGNGGAAAGQRTAIECSGRWRRASASIDVRATKN